MRCSLLGNRVRCLRHLDSIGHCHHTQCGFLQSKNGSDILAAEGLEVKDKSHHHCIHQLGSNVTGYDSGNLIRDLKPLPLDASLQVTETVWIVMIMEVDLIN